MQMGRFTNSRPSIAPPANPKGVAVLCGGFDSNLKPLRFFFSWLRDAGHNVVVFEGPGQPSARFDIGLGTSSDHPMA